jgi:hypothetical protein
VRTVVFNLKDASNPDLRGRVAAGVIPPEALAAMGAEEMASDARKSQNAQIRKEMAAEAVRGQQQQATTDQFQGVELLGGKGALLGGAFGRSVWGAFLGGTLTVAAVAARAGR